MLSRPHPSARRGQRGLSLVELMVGITVGMFVVAAASTVVVTQLVDNRRLILEVQVQQDLRAAADIITRDLRRADSWGNVFAASNGVWSGAGANNGVQPHITPSGITIGASGTGSQINFYASRANPTALGYRFHDDAIESLAGGVWQKLTDENAMRVTAFTVTSEDQPAIRAVCTKLCSDGSQSCWPTVQVRTLRVSITGESKTDSAVKRSVESVVRPRNDMVSFNDPTNPALSCPT